MWYVEVSNLTCWTKQSGRGEEDGKRKVKKGERRRRMAEKLHFLSRFFGNWTVGFHRSKKESSSMRQELHVGTRIRGFFQTSRCRGFSPTLFNSCLRVIQMVEVFGTGTIAHFSPKDLGLNAGFLGTVIGQSEVGFSRLFSNSLELNSETVWT